MFASKRAISLSYYLEHLGKVGNIWTKHKIYKKTKNIYNSIYVPALWNWHHMLDLENSDFNLKETWKVWPLEWGGGGSLG